MTTENAASGPMRWDEFRAQAVARAGMHAVSGEPKHRLAYLALGLCGEAGEVATAKHHSNTVEELGDVAWYLAMLEHETGIRTEHHLHAPPDATLGSTGLVIAACAVAEAAKRPVQGRDLPVDRMRDALCLVRRYLEGIAARYGRLSAVLAANVAKNNARYGDGFTADKARALDAKVSP